jgi:DNA-binding NarL/FixJ family response regulator
MSTPNPIRVFLVDDHTLFRQGMRALLQLGDGIEVVGEAADGLAALETFDDLKPDLTLMDLRMPRMGGVDTIEALRKKQPSSRFIVLTTYDGDEDIFRALQAGAQGYLLKDVGGEALLAAIKTVHAGRMCIPPELAQRALVRATSTDLTDRELEVLRLIADGKSNKEIGVALDISENTVKGHVMRLFDKLGVTSRTQAALIALDRGLVRKR